MRRRAAPLAYPSPNLSINTFAAAADTTSVSFIVARVAPTRKRVPLRPIIWIVVVLVTIAVLAPLGFRLGG